jgi:hypothetical protein
MEARGAHGLHRNRSHPLVIRDLRTPRYFALFLLPPVYLAKTTVVVVSQTSEVVEDDDLQVRPGENVRQLLADGIKDADQRLFLDTLGKCAHRICLTVGVQSGSGVQLAYKKAVLKSLKTA